MNGSATQNLKYSYEGKGNITTVKDSAANTTVSYTYGDSSWKDLLTKVEGVSRIYSCILSIKLKGGYYIG